VTAWRQIPKIPNRLSVFYRRYSVFFGIVNTDVGVGIGILKYPISVRFFGIPEFELEFNALVNPNHPTDDIGEES